MTKMKEAIEAALQVLEPTRLDVQNQSSHHRGHAGDDGSGESHWHVVIEAPSLAGKPRVAQHKAVYTALGDQIMQRIHALSLEIST